MSARSEIYKFIRIVAAGTTLATACSLVNSNPVEAPVTSQTPISSPASPDVATQIQVTTTPAATETPEPLSTLVISPTEIPTLVLPTETPTEMMTIFGLKEQWDHQVMGLSITVPNLLNFHNEATLVPYFATNDEEREALIQETKAGKGTAPVYIQPDGSLLIVEHSGYTNKKKNEAEGLRRYFEGENGDVSAFSDTDVAIRMQTLIGAEVQLTLNGVTADYQVVYVQKLGYGAEINRFRQDGNVALETATQLDRDKNGGVSVMDSYSGPFVIINFCGWARSDQLDQLKQAFQQWEFNGYNIFLAPK